MCCQRKGYSRAAAACTAADTVSLSFATRMTRRSSSRAASKVMRPCTGTCHSKRASGTPAFQAPLPKSGGISSSMK